MQIKTKGFKMPNGDEHIFIPPSPTETERGGIKAKVRTTEQLEVAVDQETGKAYAPLDNTLTQSGQAADAKAAGDKILQFAIKNTASGESPLVVSDSADEKVLGLRLTGKTEQVQTTGKNLANPSEFVIGTLAGDTGNVINLNQYITTGYIPVIPGKRYSTSCGNKFSLHTIMAYDKEKIKINSPLNMYSEMPEGAAYMRLSYKKIDMTNVTESDMEELKKVCMVNEGSTVLSYEQYTGGKPSPSPEYLQEIKSVGKYNETTGKYEVDIKLITGNTLPPAELSIYPGENILPYQPYKEQTLTLTSDRHITKWDNLVEQDGQIGWLYHTKEVMLSSFDDWSLSDDVPNNRTIRIYALLVNAEMNKPCYSEKYKSVESNISQIKTLDFECISIANGNYLMLKVDKNIGSTKKEFIEYFNQNDGRVLYNSANGEFIPLPQSEQNAIQALLTYYPTTVITADGGELNPEIELDYVADTKNFILNNLAQTNQALANTQAQLL